MAKQLPLDAYDLSEETVRSRFERALRQGHRSWLWPDIDIRQWQAALAQIAAVTTQVLTEGRARQALTSDTEAIGIAGFTSGMGPLLGHWLEAGLIDADAGIASVFGLHLRHNTKRMERMAKRAMATVNHLAGSGVRVTVLKGMQTAYDCFPAPGTRPLSDIDLLVAPVDKLAAGEALLELGFEPGAVVQMPPEQEWRMPCTSRVPRSLSLVHSDNPWYIDLHTSLNMRHSVAAPTIELDALMQSETGETWVLSPGADVLPPVSVALHLACHASCGLENLAMLRMTELVLVTRTAIEQKRFSWEAFVEIAERVGILASVYPALQMSERLAPGTVPEEVLQASAGQTPARVRQVIQQFRPESVQRVVRCSLDERFMWSTSLLNRLRQTVQEFFLVGIPLRDQIRIYQMRLWRLYRGTLTWRAPKGF